MTDATPESVVHVLERLGIKAEYDSGGLLLTGNDDVLTDELLAFVRSHRDELVNHLFERIRTARSVPTPSGDNSRWTDYTPRCPRCHGLSSQPAGISCAVCQLNARRALRGAA